jgi:hypothetical protein
MTRCALTICLLLPFTNLVAQQCIWTAGAPVPLRDSTLGLLPTSAPSLAVDARTLVIAASGFIPVPQATSSPADSTEARRILGAMAYVVDRETGRVTAVVAKQPNGWSNAPSSTSPMVARTTTGDVVALWPERQKHNTSAAFSIKAARYARGAWGRVGEIGGFDYIPWSDGDHMIVEHERAIFLAFAAIRDGEPGVAVMSLTGPTLDTQFVASGTPMPPRAIWMASEAHQLSLTYESVGPALPSARALATRRVRALRGTIEVGAPAYHPVAGAARILAIVPLGNGRQPAGWLLLVGTAAGTLEVRFRRTVADSIGQTLALGKSDATLIGGRPEATAAVLWAEDKRASLQLVGLLDGRTLSMTPIAAVDDIAQTPLMLPTRGGGIDLLITRLTPDRIESTLTTTGLFRMSIAPICGR